RRSRGKFARHRTRAAGKPDAEGVEDENLGCPDRLARDVAKPCRDHVVGERADGVHLPSPALMRPRWSCCNMPPAQGGLKMKIPRSAASLALALLFAIGATSFCAAKTFVYVSNAQDGNIDAYAMDTATGALTPIAKAEAAKLVMPMAVAPNKKHLYVVVRSQPLRVLTYAIEANGALTQK